MLSPLWRRGSRSHRWHGLYPPGGSEISPNREAELQGLKIQSSHPQLEIKSGDCVHIVWLDAAGVWHKSWFQAAQPRAVLPEWVMKAGLSPPPLSCVAWHLVPAQSCKMRGKNGSENPWEVWGDPCCSLKGILREDFTENQLLSLKTFSLTHYIPQQA